jgi:hypothetical protein
MTQNTARSVTAYLIGFIGWLAVAGLRTGDPWLWFAAFAVGLVAMAVAPRPLGLVAVVLGMAVSYPAALGLGLIAYLGENWALYLVVFLSTASAGFAVGLLAARVIRARRAGTAPG